MINKSPVFDSFTVYANPGFFGITELGSFMALNVELYTKPKSPVTLILDFSAVDTWDISALLWMAIALDHYRRNAGLSFLLRLPAPKESMPLKNREAAERSADYLRRWRFDKALQTLDSDVSNILVPEQKDFFDPPEPRKYYKDSRIQGESGLLQSLISRRLAEIRGLSDPFSAGTVTISSSQISQCIREFQAERIGDILAAQCGIEKRKADLFSDHLLTEALLNVQDHPHATIGFIAISVMGRTNQLILSVVDNGDSIPQTIYPRYVRDTYGDRGAVDNAAHEYDRDKTPVEDKKKATHHATLPGITRKDGNDAENAGMGLTYIKEDSVRTFNGKLTIITDCLKMTYSSDPNAIPETQEWIHSWRGNLLRIAIPLSNQPNSPRPNSR